MPKPLLKYFAYYINRAIKKGGKGVIKRFELSSTKLILIAALYFGLVLNFGFWQFVNAHFEISGWTGYAFWLSLPFFLVVPLYIFFNIIILPYIAKPLLIVLVGISSITNYAMFELGIFIDAEMFRNIVETNTREALDLVNLTSILWFVATALLPIALLLNIKIIYSSFKTELLKRLKYTLLSLLTILCFVPVSYKEYVSFGRNNREVRKLINTFNYIYAVGKHYKRQAEASRHFIILDDKPTISQDIKTTHKKLLILVVGETARAQNFSLYGYNRETNPLLGKQDIITFAETSSCGTATAISLPCMFSVLDRKNFDVDDAKYMQNLMDLIKLSGYNAIWLENDDGCKNVCHRITLEDMVAIQNPKHCEKGFCRDEVLLDGLEERLKTLKGNTVIVLHTMGSHGPTYYKRYTDGFKKFQPTCDTSDLQKCSKEEIINTYDNTILYTDFILSSAIDILKKFSEYETGLIYVSDHGESLGENNLYLHGLPYAIAPDEQTKVPFLVWLSPQLKTSAKLDEICLKNKAEQGTHSHDNLFHSVLGLLDIQTKVYNPKLDIFQSCRK